MSALPPKADIRPREGHVRYVPKAGTAEQALATFTLMKVIGRDIWIGIWAFIFALISTLRWEAEATGVRPSPAEIWWRFPKFVLGFLVASALVTLLSAGHSYQDYKQVSEPKLVAPIRDSAREAHHTSPEDSIARG
jgi:hypothetical protein